MAPWECKESGQEAELEPGTRNTLGFSRENSHLLQSKLLRPAVPHQRKPKEVPVGICAVEKAPFTITGIVTAMDDSGPGRSAQNRCYPREKYLGAHPRPFPTAISNSKSRLQEVLGYYHVQTICLGCWSHAVSYSTKEEHLTHLQTVVCKIFVVRSHFSLRFNYLCGLER